MQITEDNYYSAEMNMKYVSVSQYKMFFGTPDQEACEAAALAEVKGEIERPNNSVSLLVGSYVDAALTGDLKEFEKEHPEIYSTRGATKGELKTDFKQAQIMVERAKLVEEIKKLKENPDLLKVENKKK